MRDCFENVFNTGCPGSIDALWWICEYSRVDVITQFPFCSTAGNRCTRKELIISIFLAKNSKKRSYMGQKKLAKWSRERICFSSSLALGPTLFGVSTFEGVLKISDGDWAICRWLGIFHVCTLLYIIFLVPVTGGVIGKW